jgi:hypothetical protein
MANDPTVDEDYCTSSTMDQTTCINDTLCYWGPETEAWCWAENFECEDTTNGATDSAGDGCDWYWNYQIYCGHWDTDSFIASEMCCSCQEQYFNEEEEVSCGCYAYDETTEEGAHCGAADLYTCLDDEYCYWGPQDEYDCVEQNYYHDYTDETCQCYGYDTSADYCESAGFDNCLADENCYWGPWENYECSDQNYDYYDDYNYDTCYCLANDAAYVDDCESSTMDVDTCV